MRRMTWFRSVWVTLTVSVCVVVLHNTISRDYHSLQQEKVTTVDLSHLGVLNIPAGLRLYNNMKITKPHSSPKTKPSETELTYELKMKEIHVECRERIRFGHAQDGGWDMCVSGPYRPQYAQCLVYSFGINFDWSFDEDISSELACDVRAFDPSMELEEHSHSERVNFYPVGLGAKNEVIPMKKGQTWQMKTLGDIMHELQDDKKIIDYLKLDIEFFEWEVLDVILKQNILHRIKQIGFEAHTRVVQRRIYFPTSSKEYHTILTVIRRLEDFGFRKWYHRPNNEGMYYSEENKKYLTCCHELVYINTRFLAPVDPSRPLPAIKLDTGS